MRILSLDGGGGRGLITLQVLKAVEKKLGGQVRDHVDMIAGTSTGGILAAALAVGVPAAKLEQLYLEGIPRIFHNGWKRRVLTLWGLRDQKYSSQGLEELLDRVIGFETLAGPKPDGHRVKILIPAWDLREGKLHWFRSWTADASGVRLKDVARATSAAPTYFEPFGSYIDGGVVANSPAYRAYVEAFKLTGSGDHTILSLGTGETREPVNPRKAEGWGFGGWAKPLVGILVGGQGVEADDVLSAIYTNGSTDKYLRIQPNLADVLDVEKAMDARDPKILARWIGYGQHTVEAYDTILDHFLENWR